MDLDEVAVTHVKRPRTWLLWLKRLGWSLLTIALLLGARQSWHHYQVTKKLQETLAEMDRAEPGWRLEEIEAAREQVPEGENSARIVVAGAKLLPKNWPPPEVAELFNHLAPEEQLAPEDFARLKQELDQVGPALKEVCKLAGTSRGRHHLHYKPFVMDTMLNDQQETRRVVALLGYDVLRSSQERDIASALTSSRATLNAAGSLGDEPFLISQLIRISGVILTCQSVERTLAQGEPSLKDLSAMQVALRHEDDFSDMLVAARGARASLHESFAAIERGDVPLTHQFFGPRPSWEEFVYGWFTRDKFREAHPAMLAFMSQFVAIAQLPLYEQAAAERQLDQEFREVKQANPLAVLLIPAINKVSDASRRKHAYLRCMIVALAAERYRQKYKTWPDSLGPLCPVFLPAVPLDPFDGERLRYRFLDDGIMIYSVGNDAIDNGGNLDPAHPNQPGVDIGYRLWDVAKRRQPPRPKPAAPPAPMPPPQFVPLNK